MGTSFVDYKGFGFWTRDSFLGNFLTILLAEMQKLPAREGWQEVLRKHWLLQANIDGGCMSLGLNDFLTNDQRREFVLSVAKNALEQCDPTCRRTGELFIDLLEGRLRTTSSSPIDYLDDP